MVRADEIEELGDIDPAIIPLKIPGFLGIQKGCDIEFITATSTRVA